MSEEEGDGEGFWLRLMSECSGRTELPQGRRLLVLGDDDAEKNLLVDRLDDAPGAPCRRTAGGNGLEYRHLSVRDEYRESQARLGVWLLDGDPFYRPLLKYALDADSLSETVALVVASMSRPWDILDAVQSWTRVLREHVEGLDTFPGELERRKGAVLDRYREYVEPGLSIYGSLAADNTREIEENLGLELIVVVTRTEQMRELQSEWGYEEEHFDFIQLRLRDFCLRHGAALFYVSAREDRNCDLLRKYVLHRSYYPAFPFRLPGVLVERDAVLVPAGWDTRNKVRFLSETLPTIPPDTPYRDVVFRPARMPDDKRVAPEVYAQGDQEFLSEVQSALDRPAAELPDAFTRGECTSSTTTVVQRNVARRMARGAPRSPQKKRAEGADNTLSNFFHSLLNRRTSTPSDRPVGMSGARTYDAPRDHPRLAETDEQTNHHGGESGQCKFANSVHLSLDQGGGDRQLPEYFMSNPVCSADCSFQTESSSSSFDLEEQFSPPLDRVRSPFNPPLRTLLEKPDSLLANGETTRSKERTDGVTRSSKERTNGETRSSEKRKDEETRNNERPIGVILSSKDRMYEDTRSKEQTNEETRRKEQANGVTRSSKGRTDEDTRSREKTNEVIKSTKDQTDEDTRSKERTNEVTLSNTNRTGEITRNEERTNGVTRYSEQRSDEEMGRKERTNEVTRSSMDQTDEDTRSKERTNGMTKSSKEWTNEETRSKKRTNGVIGSGKERIDEESRPQDVGQNGETTVRID